MYSPQKEFILINTVNQALKRTTRALRPLGPLRATVRDIDMTEIHSTLKTSTNIVMIFIWGCLAGIFAYLSAPYSLLLVVIGTILGAIGGTMQYCAFEESKENFLDASSMLEVRKKLKETKWGKRYIPFLWSGNLLLVTVVIVMHKGNMALEIMAGYFTFMFIREIITLKPTIELGELSKQNPEQKH